MVSFSQRNLKKKRRIKELLLLANGQNIQLSIFLKDLVILKDLREKVVKEEVTVLSFSIETDVAG